MTPPKGWALVTGAAKRLGRVVALDLAAAGWDIVIHYHASRDEAATLADAIAATGRRAHSIGADLGDADAVATIIPFLTATLGPLAALVNNASLFEPDKNDPDGTRHRQINFAAPCRLAADLFAQLPAQACGSIVNILDGTPLPPHFSAYAASKAALRDETPAMARRMAPRTRVNALLLGPTLINPRESRAHFSTLIAATPLKLQVDPANLAATVRYIMENQAITGTVLPLDGGRHLEG